MDAAYGNDIVNNPDYGRIINNLRANRLEELMK